MAKVTLKEVSAHAGVSRSTASLVLRGSDRIPGVTADRVKASMKELGYVYNKQAANLRQSQSMSIGLVVTEIRNPYFAELTMTIEEKAHEAGYTVFVGYSRDQVDRQSALLEAMIQHQVDGIIVLPSVDSDTAEISALLSTSGASLVQVARYFTNKFDYVGADNKQAGVLLGKHLSSLQGETVGFIGGLVKSSARSERLSGLKQGLQGSSTKFDDLISIESKNNSEDGAVAMSAMLDGGVLPDIVVAYSDAVAVGILAELRKRQLEPGRDIAVASFDDIPIASLQIPPLTSIATHPITVGEVSVQILLERLKNPDTAPRKVEIEPAIKVRASTAKWRPRQQQGG